MKVLKGLSCITLLSLCLFINVAYATSIAFNENHLQQIKTQYLGKQWLMLLWSVDCPPCFKELAIIQKLQGEYDDLAIVIINTDADDELQHAREKTIKKFDLTGFKNLHFTDGLADQSRFLVDPQWYGELPRSYFIEKNGKYHGKSGLVTQDMLTQWLVQ